MYSRSVPNYILHIGAEGEGVKKGKGQNGFIGTWAGKGF